MARERGSEQSGGTAGDETIREGQVIVEERMNRRDGLVEYEGTVGEETVSAATGAPVEATVIETTVVESENADPGLFGGAAMQAGATILGGTGSTALVDDAATVSGTVPAAGNVRGADSISMATDNTAAGASTVGTVESGPIAQVQEGMRVYDAAGDEIGKVDYVKMGDPTAATTAGQGGDGGQSILDDAANVFSDDLGGGVDIDVPESFRNELMRVGFIRIDGKGWFDKDRYAAADQIASVSGDDVRLSVDKDTLPTR